jgi:hypothetical protein
MARNVRSSSRGGNRSRRPRVLIFGESINDTAALKELAEALKPSLAGRVQTRRQPLVLIKDASPRDVPDRAARIVAAVKADEVAGPVCGVIAHEDCDNCEPHDLDVANKIEAALAPIQAEVHAVVPAWELEAWWFLWPDAVAATHPTWRKPDDYVGRRVGLVQNAKEEFARCVSPRGRRDARRRVRPYSEADSVLIARKVRELGIADSPSAESASYDRFRARLTVCAA